MLYGFIYHTMHNGIELHIGNYPYMQFVGYTLKQAQKKYRETYNLKYKKITWL